MAHIIKNNDDEIGYYTGIGWDANESNATRYATEELALNIIKRHNMDAEAVEVKDTEPDTRTRKHKG